MHRRQISPVKIRPLKDPKKGNLNGEIQRIVNHASKLINEYNQSSIETVIKSDKNSLEKVDLLLRASREGLPKLTRRPDSFKSNDTKKRKRESSRDAHLSETERGSGLRNRSNNNTDSKSNTDRKMNPGKRKLKSKDKSMEKELVLERKTNKPGNKSKSPNEDTTIANEDSFEKELIFSNYTSPTSSSIPKSSKDSGTSDKEISLLYEIELKLTDSKPYNTHIDIGIQIKGEIARMNKPVWLKEVCLQQWARNLFQRSKTEKLTLNLKKQLGSIYRVKIIANSDLEEWSLDLEYVTVTDCTENRHYMFSCPRQLRKNKSIEIKEIILLYNHPVSFQVSSSISSLQNKKPQKTTKNEISDFSRSKAIAGGKEIEVRPRLTNMNNSYNNNHRKSLVPSASRFVGSAIFQAIEKNDFRRVKELCYHKDHAKKAFDKMGRNLLHLAAIHYQNNDESRRIIQHLISLTINANQQSTNGYTSLHHAVVNANLPAVQYLVEHCHADTTKIDEAGNTPLQLATEYGFRQIVDYLENVCTADQFLKSMKEKERKKEILEEDTSSCQSNETIEEFQKTDDIKRAKDDYVTKTISSKLSSTAIVYTEQDTSESLTFMEFIHSSKDDPPVFKEKVEPPVAITLMEFIRSSKDNPPEETVHPKKELKVKEEPATALTLMEFIHSSKDDPPSNKVDDKKELEVVEKIEPVVALTLMEFIHSSNDDLKDKEDKDCLKIIEKKENVEVDDQQNHLEVPDEEIILNDENNVDENEPSQEPKLINLSTGSEEVRNPLKTEEDQIIPLPVECASPKQNPSNIENVNEEENDTMDQVKRDQVEEEENKGIMFYKTIPMNKYKQSSSITNATSEQELRNLVLNETLKLENKIKDKGDSTSSISDSKSTTTVSSKTEVLSSITPLTNSDNSSVESTLKVKSDVKSEKKPYVIKETSESLSADIMKYDPFPTVDEPTKPPSMNVDAPQVISDKRAD